MIVLLPPSETKRPGGDGPPCGWPTCPHRRCGRCAPNSSTNSSRWPLTANASRRALGLLTVAGRRIERNAALRSAPTLPALHRYTGVLFDALDAGSLRGRRGGPRPARSPSDRRCSDCCAPTTRCRPTGSATSKLPGRPTLASRWRPLPNLHSPSWRRPNSSSTCGPDRMRRWAGFPVRSASTSSRNVPTDGAAWSPTSTRRTGPAGRAPGEHPIRARRRGRGGGVARRAGMRVERDGAEADRHRPGLSRL